MERFLETDRLKIRAPRKSDLDDWLTVSNEAPEKVEKFLDKCIADFEEFGFSMGTIIDKETGEFAGRAGLYFWFEAGVKQDIELGCFISKTQRNRGLGTELTIAMIDWGFENLPIRRLTGLTPQDLQNSHFVLERSGMKRVESITIDGEDLFLYEFKKEEWIPARAKRVQQKYDYMRSLMLIGV